MPSIIFIRIVQFFLCIHDITLGIVCNIQFMFEIQNHRFKMAVKVSEGKRAILRLEEELSKLLLLAQSLGMIRFYKDPKRSLKAFCTNDTRVDFHYKLNTVLFYFAYPFQIINIVFLSQLYYESKVSIELAIFFYFSLTATFVVQLVRYEFDNFKEELVVLHNGCIDLLKLQNGLIENFELERILRIPIILVSYFYFAVRYIYPIIILIFFLINWNSLVLMYTYYFYPLNCECFLAQALSSAVFAGVNIVASHLATLNLRKKSTKNLNREVLYKMYITLALLYNMANSIVAPFLKWLYAIAYYLCALILYFTIGYSSYQTGLCVIVSIAPFLTLGFHYPGKVNRISQEVCLSWNRNGPGRSIRAYKPNEKLKYKFLLRSGIVKRKCFSFQPLRINVGEYFIIDCKTMLRFWDAVVKLVNELLVTFPPRKYF